MTLEKDQLHEKCEKLKDDLTRSGSDIELNLVRGDLKDVKIALDELKKSSQEKEKALLKDIEAQKKKISTTCRVVGIGSFLCFVSSVVIHPPGPVFV